MASNLPKEYQARLRWTAPGPVDADWRVNHLNALERPKEFEYPIVYGLHAWLTYADSHQTRYESGIGEDGVLGPAWESWGRALRELLNGDCGRLDCGTLDTILLQTLLDEGFKEE